MDCIKADLASLCNAAGAGGLQEITQCAQRLLDGLVDKIETDPMGNVLGFRKANSDHAPTIMLEAHMDEIGFMVTYIDDDGFVHVASAGGIDERILTAQMVQVHGDAVYAGVFCSTPPHLAKKDGELPSLDERGIDVGMTAEEAKAHIPLGSRVTFAPCFCEMRPHIVSSKALDDRAGMAAILHCLRQLDGDLPVNVAVAFCVQEELGCRGSLPASQHIRPDAAIITDVSFARTPDVQPHECGKMGDGVLIGLSPILQNTMSRQLMDLAEEHKIPYQIEVMGGSTGTDADSVSNAVYGIPTALLSIPEKFMHTPVEMLDVWDVAAVGDLMAAYIQQGGADK